MPYNELTVRKILIFLFASGVIVFLFFGWITQVPLGWMEDDGYFYAQIAYNIGVNHFSSFDGVHATNGYHFLWCWILSFLSAMMAPFTIDKTLHLFVFLSFYLALCFFIADRYGKTLFQKIILFSFLHMGNFLMETSLLVFLLFESYRRFGEDRTWHTGYIFLFLIPLTRIDATIVAWGIPLFLLINNKKREAVLSLGLLSVGVAIHFISMRFFFESFFSVSSLLKADLQWGAVWSNLFFNTVYKAPYVFRFSLLIFLLGGGLLCMLLSKRWKENPRFFLLVGLSIFYLIHAGNGLLRSWYYIPGHVVGGAFLFSEIQKHPGFLRKRHFAKIASIFLLGISGIYWFMKIDVGVRYRKDSAEVRDFIADVARKTPEDARIFQYDVSGVVGFFLPRTVINGDGLVNSLDYATRLRQGTLSGYLDEAKICFIITNTPLPTETILSVGGMIVTKSEVEKVAEKSRKGVYFATDFVLFRRLIPHCDTGLFP